jgi:peptidoglycan-associated lipoprotein
MKRSLFFNLLLAVALVVGGTVGCKRKPTAPTPIPARGAGTTGAPGTFGPATGPGVVVPPPVEVAVGPGGGLTPTEYGTVPLPDPTDLRNMRHDREALAAYTVYFDFDRSTVKASERGKVEDVARYLLASPTQAVLIEGHCDERGTEGYNLSLGDRRALAVREYLMNLGVPESRIDTISWGESRPAVVGTTEAAYSRNRRGEFVLLLP